jgi:hypothetical protein
MIAVSELLGNDDDNDTMTGANPLTSINSTLGVNPMIKQHVNNAARLQVTCQAC